LKIARILIHSKAFDMASCLLLLRAIDYNHTLSSNKTHFKQQKVVKMPAGADTILFSGFTKKESFAELTERIEGDLKQLKGTRYRKAGLKPKLEAWRKIAQPLRTKGSPWSDTLEQLYLHLWDQDTYPNEIFITLFDLGKTAAPSMANQIKSRKGLPKSGEGATFTSFPLPVISSSSLPPPPPLSVGQRIAVYFAHKPKKIADIEFLLREIGALKEQETLIDWHFSGLPDWPEIGKAYRDYQLKYHADRNATEEQKEKAKSVNSIMGDLKAALDAVCPGQKFP
jgi:hypothetical protein